jgi:hypothetical protein
MFAMQFRAAILSCNSELQCNSSPGLPELAPRLRPGAARLGGPAHTACSEAMHLLNGGVALQNDAGGQQFATVLTQF